MKQDLLNLIILESILKINLFYMSKNTPLIKNIFVLPLESLLPETAMPKHCIY